MKFNNYKQKKQVLQKAKRIDEIGYRVMLALMFIYIIYYGFIKPKVIGHDQRYEIWVVYVPLLIGLIFFTICRNQFLSIRFQNTDNFYVKVFAFCLYLFVGLLLTFLCLMQFVMMGWDFVNYRKAKQNPIEIINCDIDRFYTGRKNSSVDFHFNNYPEQFSVRYKTIKEYIEKNPKDYYLSIEIQKGIWNYYLVNDWDIVRK